MVALLPHQQPIFLDPTPDRVFTGTRQFGKSTFATVCVIDAGISNPGADIIYVDMDIEHGDKIIWPEVERIMGEFRVPAKIASGQLNFDNGATGYIFSGAQSEIDKLQGLKPVLLIVDEAQEANALNDIITMCKPGMMRRNGRMILMGIPGRVAKIGPWWDATEGKNKELYGQHRGTFRDNTALSSEAKDRLYETEKKRLGEHSPDFLRHWRGLWPALDNALRVYHYDSALNGYDGSAPLCEMHTLGLDPGGVRDAEAVVVVGHGRADGVAYHVDEDVSEKGDGGDWTDTGDRVGPLNQKWQCSERYYDWGSAHKDALTLIWMKDRAVVMTGVPSKDPYEESKRINEQFAQRKLFIKRGSKLEQDLLYTTWDPDALGGGGQKPKYSLAYKQDAADALRCAMWGVFGYVPPAKAVKAALSPEEQERLRVANGDAYKRKEESRADKYSPPTITRPPAVNALGRRNRGY